MSLNLLRESLTMLREDFSLLRADMEAGFQNLASSFRPLSERVNSHYLEIHELRQRLEQLKKPKRGTRGH